MAAMINLPAPQQQLQHPHQIQHQQHQQPQQAPQPQAPQQQQSQQPPQSQQPQPPYGSAQAEHLKPYVGRKGDWIYKLRVEQQPIRARMCGFGDKDRRPITSPPCIRLIVYDANTGKEIDPNDVDTSFLVLTVDLWDSEGQREVNLVRHSSGAPTVSISSSTTTSFPPPLERPAMYMASHMAPPQFDQYGRPIPQPNPYAPPVNPNYYGAPAPGYQYGPPGPYGNQVPMSVPVAPPQATATGMFTRNLIGSLSVNAFKLTDTEGKLGFWFILQDLSVRTEGVFRLKMNFVDIGSGQNDNRLNQGRAPVLATCFSDPFQVYSAKKFPGVIESTPLSKTFASQGIKIPIRKDGPKQLSNQHEYDNDD